MRFASTTLLMGLTLVATSAARAGDLGTFLWRGPSHFEPSRRRPWSELSAVSGKPVRYRSSVAIVAANADQVPKQQREGWAVDRPRSGESPIEPRALRSIQKRAGMIARGQQILLGHLLGALYGTLTGGAQSGVRTVHDQVLLLALLDTTEALFRLDHDARDEAQRLTTELISRFAARRTLRGPAAAEGASIRHQLAQIHTVLQQPGEVARRALTDFSDQVYLGPVSSRVGLGLFAETAIRAGTVFVYGGRLQRSDETDPSMRALIDPFFYAERSRPGRGPSYGVDARTEGNLTRWINHSEQDYNLLHVEIACSGLVVPAYWALGDIPRGAQLLTQYDTPAARTFSFEQGLEPLTAFGHLKAEDVALGWR